VSALYQLTGTQMLLYGGMWGAAWWIVGSERRAVLHWFGFSLFTSVGLALVSLRPGGDPWLTVVLSNLLLMGAIALLVRGGECFLGLTPRDREHAVLLGIVAGASIAGGALPSDGAAWRHPGFVTTLGIAWVVSRCALRHHAELRAQFGARTAWVVTGTFAAFGALQWARLGHTLLAVDPVPLHSPHAANELLVYAMLVSTAVLNFVSLFLMVLRLTGRLTHLVAHDELTGLLNRRAMQEALAEQWSLWLLRHEPFAVVSIDLDHFKQINDRWGHPAGDAVLRATAALFQAEARTVDRVARMGGEEFLVLLPGCRADDAPAAAERLRLLLVGTPVPLPGIGPIRVTASLGVAAVEAGDRSPDEILLRVDAALYAAKRAGRNRTARWSPSLNPAS
jgi:diguanylate cyclase (GGDEF)-like protein